MKQTLLTTLADMRVKYSKMVKPEINAIIGAHFEHLRATAMDAPKKTGDKAPDFTLKSGDGKTVSLHDLLKKGPVVVSFTRGSWCPYCVEEVKALSTSYEQIKAIGGELIVISPQSLERAEKQTKDLGLKFSVLSDESNKVARSYGLAYDFPADLKDKVYLGFFQTDISKINAGHDWALPIPGRFVIDTDGTITDAKVDPDYRYRPEPSDSIEVLKSIR